MQALRFQLLQCCEDGKIDAMIVVDGDGLPLASSGDTFACDEVAARMGLIGQRIDKFAGTLLGDGAKWDVQMLKIWIDDSEMLICAVGGNASQRDTQIARGAEGALRILAA